MALLSPETQPWIDGYFEALLHHFGREYFDKAVPVLTLDEWIAPDDTIETFVGYLCERLPIEPDQVYISPKSTSKFDGYAKLIERKFNWTTYQEEYYLTVDENAIDQLTRIAPTVALTLATFELPPLPEAYRAFDIKDTDLRVIAAIFWGWGVIIGQVLESRNNHLSVWKMLTRSEYAYALAAYDALLPDRIPWHAVLPSKLAKEVDVAQAYLQTEKALPFQMSEVPETGHRGATFPPNVQAQLTQINQALLAAPDNGQLLATRGQLYAAFGLLESACADFHQSAKTYPFAIAHLADLKLSYGEYQSALDDLNQMIARDAHQVPAFALRAECHIGLNDVQSALSDLERCLELSPTAEAHLGRIVSLYESQQAPEKALMAIDRFLGHAPQSAMAHLIKGKTLTAMGQLEKAIKALDLAIGYDAELIDAYVQRGIVYRQKGEKDRARRDFEQALQREPGHEAAHYHLHTLTQMAEAERGGDWMIIWQDEDPEMLAALLALLKEAKIPFRRRDDKPVNFTGGTDGTPIILVRPKDFEEASALAERLYHAPFPDWSDDESDEELEAQMRDRKWVSRAIITGLTVGGLILGWLML